MSNQKAGSVNNDRIDIAIPTDEVIKDGFSFRWVTTKGCAGAVRRPDRLKVKLAASSGGNLEGISAVRVHRVNVPAIVRIHPLSGKGDPALQGPEIFSEEALPGSCVVQMTPKITPASTSRVANRFEIDHPLVNLFTSRFDQLSESLRPS